MTKLEFNKIFNDQILIFSNNFVNVNWEEKSVYANWLAQTFYYVNHSTHLIALSAAHFKQNENKFHRRFLAHLKEETGHENLAKNDLEKLGFEIENFPELFSTSAFYQTQYYWIQNRSPISFLGYIFALEGLAVTGGPAVYKKIMNLYGKETANFLKVHSEEDEEHLPKALKLLDDVDDFRIDEIAENFKLSVSHYKSMLQNIDGEFRFKNVG